MLLIPVALYGCETWYLALGEEHSLRMFQNRVLSRILLLKVGQKKIEESVQ
jgi:hypothetical protein